MDLDTENRLATLLLEEARRLQLEADKEGVHAYLRKPNVRHRPNSRFLTATVHGVQQVGIGPRGARWSSLGEELMALARIKEDRDRGDRRSYAPKTVSSRFISSTNRIVEVEEMWRARGKELELDSKLKNRYKDRGDSRGEKRKSDSRNQSSSSRSEEAISYSSHSDRDDGLGDDEIENFLHSRVKRGRGAIGSRMDEPGPYLKASSHGQDNLPSPDTRMEEKWECRVQGPERPLFLRSKSPDDCWHKETLDGALSTSEPCRKREKKKQKYLEENERKKKKEKKKSKHRRHHHHHHKSRRRD